MIKLSIIRSGQQLYETFMRRPTKGRGPRHTKILRVRDIPSGKSTSFKHVVMYSCFINSHLCLFLILSTSLSLSLSLSLPPPSLSLFSFLFLLSVYLSNNVLDPRKKIFWL